MSERLCADCGHAEGFADPCSVCAGQGRTCRTFVTEKTERHRGDGKSKVKRKASKRRKP